MAPGGWQVLLRGGRVPLASIVFRSDRAGAAEAGPIPGDPGVSLAEKKAARREDREPSNRKHPPVPPREMEQRVRPAEPLPVRGYNAHLSQQRFATVSDGLAYPWGLERKNIEPFRAEKRFGAAHPDPAKAAGLIVTEGPAKWSCIMHTDTSVITEITKVINRLQACPMIRVIPELICSPSD